MQTRIVAVFALALSLAACGQAKTIAQAARASAATMPEATEPVPQAQLPRVAAPTHYAVTLTIDPQKDRFSGHAEIAVLFSEPRHTLFIHGLDLHVTAAKAIAGNGKAVPVKFEQVDKSGVARLTFGSEIPKGPAKLLFDYDAPYDTSLAGLYKVVDRGDSYAFTQFENSDARRAFPSFDEPGFKAPFDIAVIAPTADKVVGNTPVASGAPAGAGMTKTVFQTTKPLPTYLIALAVGPLDIVDGGAVPPNQYRSAPVPVRGVTARGNGARMKYALSLTPSVVTALENYYGVAYPFQKLDVLAVPDFAAGAMENAGAITYRERLLLDAEKSLEARRSSLSVQAHELAHQWFGDYVTPAWWDDIWLNESFANWMESKITNTVAPTEEFSREREGSAIEVMHADEAESARQIHQPVKNQDDIDNAFDGITYDKGSAVLQMFENYVGEKDWQAGVHAYLQKFAFKNATAQDFIGTVASVTHHPEIVDAFNSYIDQPGIPEKAVSYSCEKGDKRASVTQGLYTQIGRNAVSRQWGVPMCFAGEDGKKSCSIVQGGAPVQIDLKTTCAATVMPNADGKGYYRFALSEPDWQALLKAAPKRDAADQLVLFANIDAAFRAGKASPDLYFDAIRTFAPIAQWDLLRDMRVSLRRFRTTIVKPDDQAAYRTLVAKLFGPRLAAVGFAEKPGEAPSTSLEREYLGGLMVGEARDPATIAALAKAVEPFVASAGADRNGIAPDLLADAMRAGVLAGGAPFTDRLLAAMRKSDSEDFRRMAIYAMSASNDPAVLGKESALAASLRAGEIRYLYQYMQDEPAARNALWLSLTTHFAAIEARVSSHGFGRAPGLLGGACTIGAKNALQSFFGPKVKELEGIGRPLAESEERIGYCIALKDAKGTAFEAALHKAASAS
ncbi:MAG TPA: M1 family metallopeptidase [Rhizomicrobium sp.]|jgi:alanyl aminopeptidase